MLIIFTQQSTLLSGSGGSDQKQPFHSISMLDSRSNGRVPHERMETQKWSDDRILPASLGDLSKAKPRYDPRIDSRPGTSKSKDPIDLCGHRRNFYSNVKSYHFAGANPVDHKFSMKVDLGRENDDGTMMYENVGTRRLLPPSLMHGKSTSISQTAGSSDAVHISGVGEERPVESDERVIFQAALQVSII